MLTASKTPRAAFDPNTQLETALYLEDVSVVYRVPRERVSGLKEYAIRKLQRRLQYEEFKALADVSFQVQRGEVFGVIGRNGSGKSTLLKVMARVLFPTTGRIVTRGRVAPLLELGAGFNVELTGRENIFLNSALLGRSRKEVEALLPEIIEFAEIEDFLDAPLRTYSTGMVARLGFSVATCTRPEILLVDEVLSVGDAQFQQKCMARMNSFRNQGTTIVIVSHSMATIESFCERALWLDHGVAQILGGVNEVIQAYIKMDHGAAQAEEAPALTGEVGPVPSAPPAPAPSGFLQQVAHLDQVERVYPVADHFNVEQGTVAGWLRLRSGQPHQTGIIFHTDDSRFVLYIGSFEHPEESRTGKVIVARAGGNRRALDTYYGKAIFPEVTATLSHNGEEPGLYFPEDEWHHIAMTWSGYPEGRLLLYVDGAYVGEASYDPRFDDGRKPAQYIAVGMRPREWEGEIVYNEDGTWVDSRPETTMSARDAGIDIREMRLYRGALAGFEILSLAKAGAVQVSSPQD